MDTYIAFNEFLDTIRIPVSVSEADFRLTGHTIWGLFLLALAFYFRRLAVSGWDSWKDANKIVGPGYNPGMPAIPMARKGCVGAMTNGVTMPLFWVLIAIGVDQVFMSGNAVVFMLQILTT